METPESRSLLMQQQALYDQIRDALAQLDQINRALSPQPDRGRLKPFNREEWVKELKRRGLGK